MPTPAPTAAPLGALRLLYFASFASMGLYLPYFPAWLEAHGVQGLAMSTIMALVPALSIASPPLFGAMADMLGARAFLLRFAAWGTFGSFALLALAVFTRVVPLYWAALCGVGGYALFKTPQNMLADVVALERATHYGRMRLWGSVGFLVASLLGGALIPLEPSWLLPSTMAAASLLAVSATRGLPRQSKVPRSAIGPEFRRLLRQPGYRSFLLCALLGQGSHTVCELCLSLRLADLGASGTTIGVAWAISTTTEIALMAAAPHLPLRSAGLRLLTLSLLIAALRWCLIGTVTDVGLLLLLQPLHALTFGLRWLVMLEWVRTFSAREFLATSQGLFLTASSVGASAGMVAWGTTYDEVSGPAAFAGAAGVALCAAAIAWRLESRAQVAALPGC